MHSLEAVCVHGQMLHCDEGMLCCLGGRGALSRVKVQQTCQQLYELHNVQLIFNAHLATMVTVVGVGNALHRCKNEFSCFFWLNI